MSTDIGTQFLNILSEEIKLLESWIKTSSSGGWSTHLNDPMKKRITELKEIYYDLFVKTS